MNGLSSAVGHVYIEVNELRELLVQVARIPVRVVSNGGL